MKGDQIVECDGVAAVILSSVVKGGAIRTERGGDPNARGFSRHTARGPARQFRRIGAKHVRRGGRLRRSQA